MDARVDQLDGFRFVYLLPWSDRSLLVEDTYYSDTPSMDRDNVRARINSYLSDRGWSIETVHREESAALPIPLDGAPPPVTIPTIGVRAGFFHATTGYSLAVAARIAEAISAQSAFDPESITRLTQQLSTAHWKQQGFFRMLNRLLFEAALPAARRAVFESFYGHDEALVAHFYAGRLSPIEIARVLARGSRTVAPGAAIRAAVGTRRT